EEMKESLLLMPEEFVKQLPPTIQKLYYPIQKDVYQEELRNYAGSLIASYLSIKYDAYKQKLILPENTSLDTDWLYYMNILIKNEFTPVWFGHIFAVGKIYDYLDKLSKSKKTSKALAILMPTGDINYVCVGAITTLDIARDIYL